jgi:hypothetical protein
MPSLRIRRLRDVFPPDALPAEVDQDLTARAPIEPKRFGDAIQFERSARVSDDDPSVATLTRDGVEVTFTLRDGEVLVEPSPDWVVPIALELSREMRAFLVDTAGAQYWPDGVGNRWRRAAGTVPVEAERDVEGLELPPDFSESRLVLGWPPVGLREDVVRRGVASRADTEVFRASNGRLGLRFVGHSGEARPELVLRPEGRAEIAAPDLETARWMMDVAGDIGTVCTDHHGVVWVANGLAVERVPVASDPSGEHDSRVHALLSERARHAFDLEADTSSPVERRVKKEVALPWWRRWFGLAA